MRYGFWKVFEEGDAGQLRTRVPVHMNGVSLRAGDAICPGVSFSGFNPHRVKGRDVEAFSIGGVLVLKAVYHHPHGGESRSERSHHEPLRFGGSSRYSRNRGGAFPDDDR